jgi:hypothetical protein
MMLCVVVVVCGCQERFGWDATNIQTGSTQSASHLDACRFHSQLGRLDGSDVSTGTATCRMPMTGKWKSKLYQWVHKAVGWRTFTSQQISLKWNSPTTTTSYWSARLAVVFEKDRNAVEQVFERRELVANLVANIIVGFDQRDYLLKCFLVDDEGWNDVAMKTVMLHL